MPLRVCSVLPKFPGVRREGRDVSEKMWHKFYLKFCVIVPVTALVLSFKFSGSSCRVWKTGFGFEKYILCMVSLSILLFSLMIVAKGRVVPQCSIF